ncbi:MAG TPA: hypothetical protein VLF88_02185 [Candidatus Babeliales bacterium]|nr:hypothetical protein [Candidatus Babeliales bacterium]
MSDTVGVIHSSYKLEQAWDRHARGEILGLRLHFENPDFRICRGIRRRMKSYARPLGLCVCFDNPILGDRAVLLTENVKNKTDGPLEERAERFAKHFAHGGVRREDTALAAIVLAA